MQKWKKFARFQWIFSGFGYLALMTVLTMIIADIRSGGRGGGRAIMPCETVLQIDGSLTEDRLVVECVAADAVLGVSPYARVTGYRIALEVILYLGTFCFAALECYDIWAWFCLEWQSYNTCYEAESKQIESENIGGSNFVRRSDNNSGSRGITNGAMNTAIANNLLLDARKKSAPRVGIWKFLGFVLLEVAFAFVGFALIHFKSFVQLKERSPISKQRLDVFSSLLLWFFTCVVCFHGIIFTTGIKPWGDYTPSVELAVAALVGWPHLLNYALGFKELGFLIITIGEMLVKDVMRFLVIFFVISIAYAEAFYIIQIEARTMPLTPR